MGNEDLSPQAKELFDLINATASKRVAIVSRQFLIFNHTGKIPPHLRKRELIEELEFAGLLVRVGDEMWEIPQEHRT